MTDPGRAPLPRRLLLALLVFQLVWWTAVPLLGHVSPPLDAVEMYSWALSPQWGYYKHPPLPVWIVAASQAVFGRTLFALLFPSALAVALTAAAVWLIARELFAPRQALAAVLLGATSLFCNLWATDFNHNVAQMPVWAWTLTFFYYALTRGATGWWLAAGAMLGATALAKYTAALLMPPAALLLILEPLARRHLTPLRFALGALACLALVGPHLVWLVGNDWLPVRYASERMHELAGQASWLRTFSSFVAYVLIAHLVLIVVSLALRGRGKQAAAADDDAATPSRLARRYVLFMGLGPLLAAIVIGLAGEPLHPMWSSAMLPLAGVLAVGWLGAAAARLGTRGWLASWIALEVLLGLSYVMKTSEFWYRVSPRSMRGAYPGPAVTAAALDAWRATAGTQPLRIVAGPTWEAGVVSFFAPTAPQVLTDGDTRLAPWLDDAEVEACGLLAVHPDAATLQRLVARHPRLRTLAPVTVAPLKPSFPAVTVEFAVLAPAGGCRLGQHASASLSPSSLPRP